MVWRLQRRLAAGWFSGQAREPEHHGPADGVRAFRHGAGGRKAGVGVSQAGLVPGEPSVYPPELRLRAIQFVESPGAFRARNIFTFANVLERR